MKALLLIILPLASLTASAALIGSKRDWVFIQSVGGIAIGDAKLEGNKWVLPVRCDVSGVREITTKPTALNSGLVWADSKARVSGKVIYLSIETAVAGFGSNSSECGPAKLGKIKSGSYTVTYPDPDAKDHILGVVQIGL